MANLICYNCSRLLLKSDGPVELVKGTKLICPKCYSELFEEEQPEFIQSRNKGNADINDLEGLLGMLGMMKKR